MRNQSSFFVTMTTAISLVLGALAFSSATAAAQTVLITGSNRGIGLELARVYAERGWNVIATCRTPSQATDLQAIAAEHDNLVIETLDVTDVGEVAALAEKYAGKPIDVLLNNAAIPGDRTKQKFGSLDYDLYEQVIAVNVHGPLKVAEAFIANVEASDQKKIINISSTQGSMAATVGNRGNSYFYKSSKSALHMVTRIMSIELKGQGIIVGLVSPGWVDTNFGGMPSMQGMITPQESAQSVAAVIDDYDMEMSGLLYSHKGELEAW